MKSYSMYSLVWHHSLSVITLRFVHVGVRINSLLSLLGQSILFYIMLISLLVITWLVPSSELLQVKYLYTSVCKKVLAQT